MRAVPVYKARSTLNAIDDLMREATSRRCNISMDDDAWTQASLPVRLGGIGVRRVADTALPAYIVSMDATKELVRLITRHDNDDGPAPLASAIEAFAEHQ